MKIHFLGASGSGTSSIGKRISQLLQIPFFESDDIFWENTAIPFTRKRDSDERKAMLNDIISENEDWVISGSAMRWGDRLLSASELIVLVTCPTEERIRRLKIRESSRFGERILSGNDMHQNHAAFLKWASSYDEGGPEMRSLQSERSWLAQAGCPTMIIENTVFDRTVDSIILKVKSGRM